MSATRRSPALTISLALIVVATTIILAARGWSFYWMSVQDRVEHPDFRTLRPSGLLGNGYGWVAALLIVLNLAYLERSRCSTARVQRMLARRESARCSARGAASTASSRC